MFRICEVGQFYEKDAAKIVHTVLDALQYLHLLNVVHRDIKAGSSFLTISLKISYSKTETLIQNC
jgi:serine/threonine protein kinase